MPFHVFFVCLCGFGCFVLCSFLCFRCFVLFWLCVFWSGLCTGHHTDYEGLLLLFVAALTFVTAWYALINSQQVTACVTTWREPQRRWSKKKRVFEWDAKKKTQGGTRFRTGLRCPRGSVGRASFLSTQIDCRWWIDSPLVHG